MASCARNIRAKNYYNWISLLKVTIDNVRDVFSVQGNASLMYGSVAHYIRGRPNEPY